MGTGSGDCGRAAVGESGVPNQAGTARSAWQLGGQSVKTDCLFSSQQHINRGIVQGSGVGPMLYIVMEGDLHTLSHSLI